MKYLFLLMPLWAWGFQADWSRKASLPESGSRQNIYNLSGDQLESMSEEGYIHALNYPVEITGALIPYNSLDYFFRAPTKNLLKKMVFNIAKTQTPFKSMDEMFDWLGLSPYPEAPEKQIPFENWFSSQERMGATIIHRNGAKGLTFSCAICHSANLFGVPVMGLTNKTPRSNHFFYLAKKYIPYVPPALLTLATNSNKWERSLFARTKKNLQAVGVVLPQVLGLDTSLPQVALSLARRNPDPYATKSRRFEKRPRPNRIATHVADSKPMPWWNLKYKTRWLADGSIIQGNPVLTNFLWNEIGRGTDLVQLEKWMKNNQKKIDELTVAAFNNEAPLYTDFFPAEDIDLESAKRGESLFNQTCKKCHGEYVKAWSFDNVDQLSAKDKLKTIEVKYHKKTPVMNVGTDPGRYLGIKYFAKELNDLAISKWMKTVVVPQKGYVPPPLVGIWARWPYLHNNSVPTLCAILTPWYKRPVKFWVVPPVDKERDFDRECNGFPKSALVDKKWKRDKRAFFYTKKRGLSNQGHTSMLLNADGSEKFSSEDVGDLVSFLKTL